MSDILLFMVCMIDGLILMILSVYIIILLSDLECDFLNTKQGCKKLNQWVLPEMVATSVIPVLYLLLWHWFLFLLVAPFAGYLAHRYVTLRPGSMGVYDPTEIRNRGMLARFQKEALFKIGYHVVVFVISLYGFFMALIF
ncbi:protein cornichon homolog 4-like [Halichondria panicea]|uniref:protein cornichon homolog 4-like n=1 Tax=Halichondria panicea TaxID=6063 RepID=UPI00312B816E